jgi:hypothetical protein
MPQAGPSFALSRLGELFMYLTSTMKRTLAIGGISLLAVVGLIGWSRSTSASETAVNSPAANWYTPQAAAAAGVPRDPSARVVYAPSPFGSETPVQPAYIAQPDPEPVAYSTREQPIVRAASPRHHARRVVIKKRPLKNSAAIVGGAAAGGALIGALAGGGKGAAIGALAGGGGGLVYDRVTHKKKVVQ